MLVMHLCHPASFSSPRKIPPVKTKRKFFETGLRLHELAPSRKRFQVYSRTLAVVSSQETSQRAEEGDVVQVHFTVFGEQDERLESSKDAGQPLAFEIGSSAIINNELLAAFDAGIRGLSRGETKRIELQSLQDSWKPELLFKVPQDHPEVMRLQGKFSKTGGLKSGMIVELTNGSQAQVMDVSDNIVVLDANDAMAGRKITFEIELASLEKSQSQ